MSPEEIDERQEVLLRAVMAEVGCPADSNHMLCMERNTLHLETRLYHHDDMPPHTEHDEDPETALIFRDLDMRELSDEAVKRQIIDFFKRHHDDAVTQGVTGEFDEDAERARLQPV